jgi:phosphatidylserine synthase
VVCLADEASRESVEAAVARRPPPPGFTVEYVVGDRPGHEGRTRVHVDGAGVYTADILARAAASGESPDPILVIAEPADVGRVVKRLKELNRKSIDQDGVISYFFFRPISGLMTRLVIDTFVTPNQVSIAAMAFGVAAAICAGFGGYTMVAVAGILYWVGAVVDCVDGEIARFRIEGSKAGEWLDTLADDVSTYGLLAGLGVGLVGDGYPGWWNLVGIGGAVVGFVVQAKIYVDLHRWGMTIDTAQYPWFFGAPSGAGSQERGLFGLLFYWFAFLFRRDTFVTIIAVLLCCDLRRFATSVLAAGVVVVLGLFVVHTVVTALGKGRS